MAEKRNHCERVTDWYIALMLILFPFYVEGDYTTLTAGKYRIFLILCGGYVLAMGLLSLIEKRRIRRQRAECWAMAYLMITLFSAAASPYTGVWLGNGRHEGAVTIAIYVLSFLFLSRYGQVKPWQLHLLGGSVGLYVCICLWQIAGGNPLGLYPGTLDYADGGVLYNGAFLGTMGNAGLSGAWLSLAVPMLAAAVLLKRKVRWLLFPLVLSGVAIALMDISAAVLAVSGSILLALPVLAPKEKRVMRINFTVIAISLILLLIWLIPLPGTAGELHLLLHGTVDDSFGSGRIGIWRQLLSYVPEQWLLGSGPDTVGLLGLVPFVGENGGGEQVVRAIDVAHNEYLQILICQGVFALAAWLGLLLSLGTGWLRSRNAAGKILGCGVLGYAMQAFFGISMCITAPLFWLALGLLSASLRPEGEEKRKHREKNCVQEESAVL